jgi:pilus assembly protein Flp/PilA
MMTGCVSFLLGLVERKGSRIVRRLTEDRRGVTAIEYGLIAALIAIAAIIAMTAVGTSLTNVFSTVAGDLWGQEANAALRVLAARSPIPGRSSGPVDREVAAPGNARFRERPPKPPLPYEPAVDVGLDVP